MGKVTFDKSLHASDKLGMSLDSIAAKQVISSIV